MASSVTQNEAVDQLEKIDAAFNVWDNCKVNVITNESKGNVISFKAMRDAYVLKWPAGPVRCIDATDFTNFEFLVACAELKFLTSEKLVEAFLHSKMYKEAEFETSRHQHEDEVLWVGNGGDLLYLVHVSQNEIIFATTRLALKSIRTIAQLLWPVFKERVRNNLFDSSTTSDPVPDCNKYSASLQSSLDAAVASGSSTSDGHHVRYPVTDDMKKVMVDEVNSLNLDPRIKQQFVFDLKMFPDRDRFYWRDRVDFLRFSCSSAVVSTPKQAVAGTSAQDTEEKADEKLEQLLEKISNLQETINRNELVLVKISEEKVNDGSGSAVREELQQLSQIMKGVESSLEQMHLYRRECNSGEKESSKRLEDLAASKIESTSSTGEQVKKLNGTINTIRRTVEKLEVGVKQNTILLQRLAEKMNVSAVLLSPEASALYHNPVVHPIPLYKRILPASDPK